LTDSLYQSFNKLGHPTILVIGDPILDHYVWGDVSRVSPEAPIPVVRQEGEDFKPGGAGCVCFNLQQLEAKVMFCGVLGVDPEADQLRGLLEPYGIDLSGLKPSGKRITNRKTRFIARAQQMLRVDREVTDPISSETEAELKAFLAERIPQANLVVVSDYDKGVVTPGLMELVSAQCRAKGIPCISDPARIPDYSKYRGLTLISPNRAEAETASRIPIRDGKSLAAAAHKLLDDHDLQYVAVTRDKDGISLFGRDGTEFHDPAQAKDVYDVTGAGDMVISVMGLVLAGGGTVEDSVRLANVAAGIEVGKLGVAPVSRQEIREALVQRASVSKLKTLDELLPLLGKCRVTGKKIVFTNGCFDILHQGHIELFQTARAFGDVLIVAINSDASVRRLKGPKRPILAENERALLLSALAAVDYVVIFEDDTPIPLLKTIRPDVLVKGAQYSVDQVVGHEVVEAYGGKIKLVPHVEGISTTDIVQRILERHQ
jgi:D-beta-D-heptose 7-phosphate kinase/D-beta-D-heptose 1-phosphate adenosyltransferase